MDGLVLVLAVLLNPHAKNDARSGEHMSCGGASDGADGTATAVVPASGVPHDTAQKDPVEDHPMLTVV